MADPLSGEFSAPKPERFEIQRELARGGMGVVYDVFDHRFGRRVALKRARGDVDSASARLLREAEVAGALSHAHTLPVLEVGKDRDGVWMISPLLDGPSIAEKTTVDALDALVQAARGVGHAHELGFVHRDLKPANILVADRAVVIDWGLAVRPVEGPESRLTRTGMHVGSAGFTAPEQRLGQPPDPRVDVWSLGAILWSILEGRHPGASGTSPSLEHQVLSGAYRPLAGPIGDVANHALDGDPTRRYANGAEFADALAAALRTPADQRWRPGAGAAVALAAVVGVFVIAAIAVVRTPAPTSVALDDGAREAFARRLLKEGETQTALRVSEPLQAPEWAAIPRITPVEGRRWECEGIEVADERLLCVGQVSTLIDLETERAHSLPLGDGPTGLMQDGIWLARGRELQTWSPTAPGRRIQAGHTIGRAFDGGDVVLLHVEGGITLIDSSVDSKRAGAIIEQVQPRSVLTPTGFLVVPESGPVLRIGLDAEVSEIDLENRPGEVVGMGEVGEHTVIVWDRGPIVWLDAEMRVVHSSNLPPRTKVHDAAMNDRGILMATSRKGLLVMDATGAWLGQVQEAYADEVEASDSAFMVRRRSEVIELDWTDEGPLAWYVGAPVTAMLVEPGSGLWTGTRDGDVARWSRAPRTFATAPRLVRRLWQDGSDVVAHTLGLQGVLVIRNDTSTLRPGLAGKLVMPFREGYASGFWGPGGVVVVDADGNSDARWALPNLEVGGMATRNGGVAVLSTSHEILRAAPGSDDLLPVGVFPEVERLEILDDGALLVSGVGRVGRIDGHSLRWLASLPAEPTALTQEGERCAAGTRAGGAHVFDCQTGEVFLSLDAHDEDVWGIQIQDDTLYTASLDGVVRRFVLR